MSDSIQIVAIPERDQNIDSFCPLCGEHNSGESGYKPCKHLLFIYLNLADGIEYIREDLKPLLAGVPYLKQATALKKLPIKNAFLFEEQTVMAHFMIAYEYIDE